MAFFANCQPKHPNEHCEAFLEFLGSSQVATLNDVENHCDNFIRSFAENTITQARSQKFAMGGAVWGSGGGAPSRRRPMGVWGRSPQPPEAGGLGAKPPAAGGTGVWGRSPQRSKILHFFGKVTSF